jgi:hypothetical protein
MKKVGNRHTLLSGLSLKKSEETWGLSSDSFNNCPESSKGTGKIAEGEIRLVKIPKYQKVHPFYELRRRKVSAARLYNF